MNAYSKNDGWFVKSIKYSFIFILLFWILQIIQYLGLDLSGFGIYPRTLNGLLGIITAPFIHGDFQHLIANTVPFFILSCFLFFFYKKNAIPYLIFIWITAGLLTWIIGRQAYHIGASSIIYGLASFLFFGGIFSKKAKLIIPAIIVVAAYSSLVWGIFPGDFGVSWEGHLSGAIAGFIWAYITRKSLRSPYI